MAAKRGLMIGLIVGAVIGVLVAAAIVFIALQFDDNPDGFAPLALFGLFTAAIIAGAGAVIGLIIGAIVGALAA